MSVLIEDLNTELNKRHPGTNLTFDEHKKRGLYFWFQPIKRHLQNGRVEVEGFGSMIMLGGYSYLGLINHPEIAKKAKEAIDLYGTGTQGSPLLAGTLQLRCELEKALAEFKGTEDAVCFSSGYVANLSTITALLERDDVVICDKLNHASILDGCLSSQARLMRFNHNDLDSLETRLKKTASFKRKLVIIDAVYSMDGDIANLPEISELCDKYGASLMVDEAHSVGVIGKCGTGIEEHFGMPSDTIDIKMGTLSKAIPSNGGYIAGSKNLCNFLRHTARGLIYSGAPSGVTVASALAGLTILRNDSKRVHNLHERAVYFRNRLKEKGIQTGLSQTAIIPVICGETEAAVLLGKYCQDHKVFVHAIYPPTVAVGTARIRVSIMADHTYADLDYCIDVIVNGAREIGILA